MPIDLFDWYSHSTISNYMLNHYSQTCPERHFLSICSTKCLILVQSPCNHHHFNTQQLIKEKTTNLVADQKYKKWLCPEMYDSESIRRKLLMVHSSIYC